MAEAGAKTYRLPTWQLIVFWPFILGFLLAGIGFIPIYFLYPREKDGPFFLVVGVALVAMSFGLCWLVIESRIVVTESGIVTGRIRHRTISWDSIEIFKVGRESNARGMSYSRLYALVGAEWIALPGALGSSERVNAITADLVSAQRDYLAERKHGPNSH